MECLPSDVYLEFRKDTLEVVRKTFGLEEPGAIRTLVDMLEEWVQQQNHFTKKDFDRRYLETSIIVSKGSIERAKTRLDRGCTFRSLMPHMFEICDIKHIHQTDLKDLKHAVLPKLTTNHERVYILRNVGKKFSDTFIPNFLRCLPLVTEYIRRNDYAVTNVLVLDYLDTNLMELSSKMTISAMQEIMAVLLDCCGFRLKAIYIISSSKFVDIIVSLFKQAMSAKLGQRINVLKNRESVKNIIENDILPKDYGGTEKALDELHEDFLSAITSADHLKYLKDIFSARTDESMRPSGKFNEEHLGMPGSFRKLNVD